MSLNPAGPFAIFIFTIRTKRQQKANTPQPCTLAQKHKQLNRELDEPKASVNTPASQYGKEGSPLIDLMVTMTTVKSVKSPCPGCPGGVLD